MYNDEVFTYSESLRHWLTLGKQVRGTDEVLQIFFPPLCSLLACERTGAPWLLPIPGPAVISAGDLPLFVDRGPPIKPPGPQLCRGSLCRSWLRPVICTSEGAWFMA